MRRKEFDFTAMYRHRFPFSADRTPGPALVAAARDCTLAAAALPWLILYLLVAGFVLAGSEHSVTPLYFEAAANFFRGDDLYVSGGRGFLYFPQAAILSAPFSLLPRLAGDLLWRLTTISVFALGVYRLSRLATASRPNAVFAAMSWLSATLAWSSALNGQATLTMAGLLMFAAGDIADRRHWRAAAVLALAVAVKPLAIVVLLVAAVYWPRLALRLPVTCGVAALAPFLLQSTGYVAEQYADCMTMLRDAARLGAQKPWAQLFGMLHVLEIELSESFQTGARIVAALLTLTAGWHARRRLEPARALLYVYALATCYLMLFNPRTENNSYAMLAPVIGWCCAEALLIERRWRPGLMFVVIAVGTIGSHEFGRQLLPASRAVWLAPLMALWFTVVLVIRLFREAAGAAAAERQPTVTLSNVSASRLMPDLRPVATPPHEAPVAAASSADRSA